MGQMVKVWHTLVLFVLLDVSIGNHRIGFDPASFNHEEMEMDIEKDSYNGQGDFMELIHG